MDHLKIIYILWFRQVKRYLRSKARIVGSLGQPILFLVALGFGLGPVFEKAGGGNYLQFLAPGIICMSILFTAVFSGIEVIWDKQFGFLKETLVAPVSRFDIMLGRTLGGATVATGQGLLVLILSIIIGFRPNILYIIPAVIIMFLIALLFTALGTAMASKIEDMQGFGLIVNFVIMPLFFLSGAIFPLSGLPNVLAIITRINPLTYGVDAMRGLLSSSGFFSVGLDTSVLVAVTLLVLFIGSHLFSKLQA